MVNKEISSIEWLGKEPFEEFRPLNRQMGKCVAAFVNRCPGRVFGTMGMEMRLHKSHKAIIKHGIFFLGVEEFSWVGLFPTNDGLDGVVEGILCGVLLGRFVFGFVREFVGGMSWVCGKGKPTRCSNTTEAERTPKIFGSYFAGFDVDFEGFWGKVVQF